MHRNLLPAVTLISLFIICGGGKAIAQSGTNNTIQERLKDYCVQVPYEEIYGHTDRDVYVAGEEMWFTAYLFDRQSGKISHRSKVAYFELLNPDDKPIIQKRLLISDGICPGNAHLPDTLSPGTYTCRIYTNWMKNFLPGNAFMKDITIVNPFITSSFRGKVIYIEHKPSKINIEFFPEGGRLLNGVPSKIAVRVTDEYQKGLAITGVVKNSRGDSVTCFNTNRFGLTSFEMTPERGINYYVLHAGAINYLPLISDEGCALKTDYLGKGQVTITISERRSSYSSDRQEYSILIQSQGNTGYFETFTIPGGSKTIILSKQGLPEGISQITLFNQNLSPVCERFIYVSHDYTRDEVDPGFSDRYPRRERVFMNLEQVTGNNTSLNPSGLSISVTPLTYKEFNNDIEDFMIFGTQYGRLPWEGIAAQTNEPDEKDFDNFLLCAKSRWIRWNDILSANSGPLTYSMEENAQLLSGTIKGRDENMSAVNQSLTLSIPGKVASYYHADTDDKGNFSFLLPVDQIQRNLIIQPETTEESFSVEIQSSFSSSLPLSVAFKDSLDAAKSAVCSDISTRYQVRRIFETDVKKEIPVDQSGSQPVKRFYGKPEIELIMSDYIKLPVMQEVFFELTPGVRLREKRSGYEMKILNPFTGVYYDEPATVMIDGVVINDLTTLANIDPEIIERVDIVRTPYITGNYQHNGIIHVITLSGKYNNLTLPDNAVKLSYRVTEPVPLFVSPDYSDPVKKQSRIPDFRNTLYWDPAVKPDKEGKVSVGFWTSDLQGEYLIDVQGITAEGKPVSFKKTITVY